MFRSPPSFPQLHHVTLWAQRVTSSSLILMQTGTRVRRSLNYKYTGWNCPPGFLLFNSPYKIKYSFAVCHVIMNCWAVVFSHAMKMAFEWNSAHWLQKFLRKPPTKYILNRRTFCVSVSHSFLPPPYFLSVWVLIFCSCHIWKVKALCRYCPSFPPVSVSQKVKHRFII